MSESESDQDLNVSQYDVEDDLNAYGSPAYTGRKKQLFVERMWVY
jgi:hypothetical protein